MSITSDEHLMAAAFSAARSLEPSDEEIAFVVNRLRSRPPAAGRRGRSSGAAWRRRAAAALAGVVLATGVYAAPSTRAALDDVAQSFSAWLAGDSERAPGRALRANEEAPDYFRDRRYATDARVIAEAGPYKLYATRIADGSVEFDLGDTGVALGFSPSAFEQRSLYVLGPGSMAGADAEGHVPLFGVTARSVASVELRYRSGPPLRLDTVDGGFVLLAQPERGPREVVALGANGNEVERQLVDASDHYGPRIDWSAYGPAD